MNATDTRLEAKLEYCRSRWTAVLANYIALHSRGPKGDRFGLSPERSRMEAEARVSAALQEWDETHGQEGP